MIGSSDGTRSMTSRLSSRTTAITSRRHTTRPMTFGWRVRPYRSGGILLGSILMAQGITSRQPARCEHSGQISQKYGDLANELYKSSRVMYNLASLNSNSELGISQLRREMILRFHLLTMCEASAIKGCECWRVVTGWQRTYRRTGIGWITSLKSSSVATSKKSFSSSRTILIGLSPAVFVSALGVALWQGYSAPILWALSMWTLFATTLCLSVLSIRLA